MSEENNPNDLTDAAIRLNVEQTLFKRGQQIHDLEYKSLLLGLNNGVGVKNLTTEERAIIQSPFAEPPVYERVVSSGIAPIDPEILRQHAMQLGTDSASNFPKANVTISEPDRWSVSPTVFHQQEKELKDKLKNYSAEDMLRIISEAEKRKDYFLNRITCAANYHSGYGLLVSARHWDEQMHAQYDAAKEGHDAKRHADPALDAYPEGHLFAQGFIDKFGKFQTREQAWVIAEAAGQIIRRVGGDHINGGRLYSENLY